MTVKMPRAEGKGRHGESHLGDDESERRDENSQPKSRGKKNAVILLLLKTRSCAPFSLFLPICHHHSFSPGLLSPARKGKPSPPAEPGQPAVAFQRPAAATGESVNIWNPPALLAPRPRLERRREWAHRSSAVPRLRPPAVRQVRREVGGLERERQAEAFSSSSAPAWPHRRLVSVVKQPPLVAHASKKSRGRWRRRRRLRAVVGA